ncbi:MAG: aspartate aminotransferase family protein [Parvularculaceae bacterium]
MALSSDANDVLSAPPTSPIIKSYFARTPKSASLHDVARRVMPGGTSRQAGYWTPYPLSVERASGAYFWDADGNRYLDLVNNYTAMVHGHAYPPIVEAAQRQIAKGAGWAAANPIQNELAEQLVERLPSVDQIRFTNSGTEAGALAFTIARKITGRQKLLMARFGYHGSLLEFETGSFGHEGPITYLATYNDLNDFKAVLAEHGSELAAVFLEPVLGSGGVIGSNAEFLNGVKEAAHAAGALFVLDEVLTYRFAVGGCQSLMDIDPDLTMTGKGIGGGFPVGAVGGKRDLLRIFDPADMKVFHTGTFNANPVTMAAGCVSVRELTAERISTMHALTETLKNGLISAIKKFDLPVSINHYGSCLNLYFSEEPPASSIVREDAEIMTKFHHAAMNRGLFIAPRGMMALSTVTTKEHIAEALECVEAALKDVTAELG